ncbi:retinol dehydrogenase 8-like [Xenia sp. Carnegie-2017]|uniref:retinol dehydrogenase 8-like n=1 Tax=Xenia sp. Carnegie-2017 TaxID=2897299 RepID=UPI001F03D75D|nr:retinol dehydrogenase 8-like [Xenia sp. Carnegie-2017]
MGEEIVFITGTSHGLGLSTAEMLAKQTKRKFKVYASMRNTSKKGELVKKTAGCSNLIVIEVDVCSEASVNAAVKQILEKEGRIDFVVNNAAVAWCGPLEVQPWETITNLYETNFFGPLRVIRAVVPSMKKNKKGRIINISSVSALHAFPFITVYASTKCALEGITDSLAPELAVFNVHISTVIPGAIATGGDFKFYSGDLKADDPTKVLGEKFFANTQKMASQAQSPAEVAEYILKAMTDEKPQPHYITNKGFEEGFGKAKFCDLTGRIPFEMSKSFLA